MNDMVNGCFELVGAAFLLLNIRQLMQDKRVQGVDWRSVAFFFGWGVWNLFYYPSLGQWWSFAGGVAIVTVNCLWLTLVFWYSVGQPACYPGQVQENI